MTITLDIYRSGQFHRTLNDENPSGILGLILGLHPAKERSRYKVTLSLIGRMQTLTQHWHFVRDMQSTILVQPSTQLSAWPPVQPAEAAIKYFSSCNGWGANKIIPDSKVHGANTGPIWDQQDPGGPRVVPMDPVIWDVTFLQSVSHLMIAWGHISNKSPQPFITRLIQDYTFIT